MAALFAAGAQGVHEDGDDLVTHFPAETDVDAVVAAVRSAAPSASLDLGRSDETDWSVAWRDRLKSHDLGLVTISPPWLAAGLDPARTVIIEPAMAFGTGDHPTTRGSVRLLQRQMSPGLVVADLGSGSAVLSIAAAKLGASRVFAIEYDPDAISNAELNVRANAVEGVVHVFEGDAGVLLPLIAPVTVATKNVTPPCPDCCPRWWLWPYSPPMISQRPLFTTAIPLEPLWWAWQSMRIIRVSSWFDAPSSKL